MVAYGVNGLHGIGDNNDDDNDNDDDDNDVPDDTDNDRSGANLGAH